jgi:tripartite-type tricarboxylate transporter receptor subunit TctC
MTGISPAPQVGSRREFLRMFGLTTAGSILAACAPAAAPAKPTTSPPTAPPVSKPAAAATTAPPAKSAGEDPALVSLWSGSPMTWIVGFAPGPGGMNDALNRVVARHISKHLPGNPNTIVENAVGANGLIAANKLYESKPDGLTAGTVERSMPTRQLMGEEGVRFDVNKLTWLGSISSEPVLLMLHQRSGITNVKDLETKSVKLAGFPGSINHAIQLMARDVLGWKLSAFPVYQGGQAANLVAMDRGEIDGLLITWSAIFQPREEEIRSKTLVPIALWGPKLNHPLLAGVPTADDLYADKSAEVKQLLNLTTRPYSWAWPYVAPPGLPANVANAMRSAFMATMADPDFVTEVTNLKVPVDPLPGERLQEMIGEYYKTPQAITDQLKGYMAAE